MSCGDAPRCCVLVLRLAKHYNSDTLILLHPQSNVFLYTSNACGNYVTTCLFRKKKTCKHNELNSKFTTTKNFTFFVRRRYVSLRPTENKITFTKDRTIRKRNTKNINNERASYPMQKSNDQACPSPLAIYYDSALATFANMINYN